MEPSGSCGWDGTDEHLAQDGEEKAEHGAWGWDRTGLSSEVSDGDTLASSGERPVAQSPPVPLRAPQSVLSGSRAGTMWRFMFRSRRVPGLVGAPCRPPLPPAPAPRPHLQLLSPSASLRRASVTPPRGSRGPRLPR